MLLVGDLGGTNLRLGIWHQGRLSAVRRFEVAAVPSLESAVGQYLAQSPQSPSRACIGVAGPLQGNRCDHTNAGWAVDGDRVAAETDLESVLLINDFHAAAKGTLLLDGDTDCIPLGGRLGEGTRVVLGAGTGLGVAIVDSGHVISGEGGHQDFAPRGALQVDLLLWLTERLGRVSFEQVCSGPGLLNIHRFLSTRATAFPAQSPEQVAANAATCPVAREALETFADIYGSFAGDLALLTGATGGVWLAGGIAAKLQDVLQSRFRAAFEDKPPREHLLRPIGIRLITHPEPGLLGAGAVLSERL